MSDDTMTILEIAATMNDAELAQVIRELLQEKAKRDDQRP